jgi:hypothetical protein
MASNRGSRRRRVFQKPTACKPPVGPCQPPAAGPEPPPLDGHGDANQLGHPNPIHYDGFWSGFPSYCFSQWFPGAPMYGAFHPNDPLYTDGTIQKNAIGDELVFPPQHV